MLRIHVPTSPASTTINLGPSHYRGDILGHTNVQALVDLAGGISSGVIAKLHPHHLEGTTGELVRNKCKETFDTSERVIRKNHILSLCTPDKENLLPNYRFIQPQLCL